MDSRLTPIEKKQMLSVCGLPDLTFIYAERSGDTLFRLALFSSSDLILLPPECSVASAVEIYRPDTAFLLMHDLGSDLVRASQVSEGTGLIDFFLPFPLALLPGPGSQRTIFDEEAVERVDDVFQAFESLEKLLRTSPQWTIDIPLDPKLRIQVDRTSNLKSFHMRSIDPLSDGASRFSSTVPAIRLESGEGGFSAAVDRAIREAESSQRHRHASGDPLRLLDL